jgi:hypothetical protein
MKTFSKKMGTRLRLDQHGFGKGSMWVIGTEL